MQTKHRFVFNCTYIDSINPRGQVSIFKSISNGKGRKKTKSSKPKKRKKPHDDDDHETSYRHLPISLKRKSFESMSVGGDELRKKRRAIIDREADKEANDNNFIERLESNEKYCENTNCVCFHDS